MRRIVRNLAISFAVWSVLLIPLVIQAYQVNVAAGMTPHPRGYLLHPALRYAIMALLTLPIFAWTRRFPLRGGRLPQAIAAHLAGFCAFFLVFAWFRYLTILVFPLYGPNTYRIVLNSLLQRSLIEQVWSYGAIVAAAHAVYFYRDARQREAELARQQLQILKLQLHPHFLFNALHGISALMSSDVEAARTAIARFSDLLRTALRHTERDEITVTQELTFVDSYLQLEQLRLGSRLSYSIHAEPDVAGAVVPTMVLQPLVENAVRHGIERRRAGGVVTVDVRSDRQRLRITVVNDAPPDGVENRAGIGLSNTRGRLRTLHGDDQMLSMRRRDDERVEVVIDLPLRSVEHQLAS